MREKAHEHLDAILLSMGGGSFTVYGCLQGVSDFCKIIMPIISVLSFGIYIIINWKTIRGFFKTKI